MLSFDMTLDHVRPVGNVVAVETFELVIPFAQDALPEERAQV